jgi:hypothetical protein
MTESLGEDVVAALTSMVDTADRLPGQYKAEFTLTYWSGVQAPAEAWLCTVEGDIHGDDGDTFSILGHTAAEALRKASEEAWKRVADT